MADIEHDLRDMFDATDPPLTAIAEPGDSFRIGDASWTWDVQDGRAATSGDLVLITSVERVEQALVIRRTLRNTGAAPSPPINLCEPLALRLNHPSSRWNFLYALGGTSESFSPPLAFRHSMCFAVGERLALSSHEDGRSSNRHLPLLIGHARGRDTGFFCGLEWSGTWNIEVTADPTGMPRLALGVPVEQLTLAPGESLILPPVHLGLFRGGIDAGGNALRRHIHRHVLPTFDGRPPVGRVSYDHWFGLANRFDTDVLKAQADRAAELGVEVFVHDASWFEGGFPAGVGNWKRCDPAKHPRGLEDFAEYVRRKGMDFGLWFEIERAAPGTEAVVDHPEWFDPDGRGQFHLNLAIPAAQDWAIGTISHWVERLDLRWTRWDYNIGPASVWRRLDPTGKVQFHYMQGLYRVLDTLRQRHPKWMIESCASGGRRIDLGMLRRSHTVWISDHVGLPYNCRYMQARANRFLPGCLLNSSVAVERGRGDTGCDDAAILSRMLGKLAFDGDIASWSPALTERYARWVAAFKQVRHLLVQDFFQLLPQPTLAEHGDVLQFSSYDGRHNVLFAFAGIDGLALRVTLPDAEQPPTVARLLDGEPVAVRGSSFDLALGPEEAGCWTIDRAGATSKVATAWYAIISAR